MDHSTHLQSLVRFCLKAPKGSTIVEMGCGFNSTPILSEICNALGLTFVVYYQDVNFQSQIEPLVERVQWNRVADWKRFKLDIQCYLVFLDNEQKVKNRRKHIEKSLITNSKYIVVSDSEIYGEKTDINWGEQYIGETFDDLKPNTFIIDCENTIKKRKYYDVKKTNNDGKKLTFFDSKVNFDKKDEKSTNLAKSKTAVVCAFQPARIVNGQRQGDYDEHYREYIQRLHDGIQQNTTNLIDFYCVTIMDISDLKGVKKITPLKSDWKGWHIKSEVFRPELWEDYDRVLYVDLDTMIINNIDNIIESDDELVMLRHFYDSSVWETGMIFFNPKLLQHLYKEFTVRKNKLSEGVKDADIITNYLNMQKLTPKFFQDKYMVGSYKVHCQTTDYKHFQIICFHGFPRPHNIKWDLTAKCNPKGPRQGRRHAQRPEPVPPMFEGEDCWIIGGGPSLRNVDLDKLLAEKNVLGINDGYLYDCCDVCFFGDTVWYSTHKEALAKWDHPIYTSSACATSVHFLDLIGFGLSKNKNELGWNSNSGMAGINLALHFGASRIFLLGFDMCFSESGESNWHKNIRKVNQNTYRCFLSHQRNIERDWRKYFKKVDIFNCLVGDNPSQLTVFPRVKLDEILGINDKELYI